MNIAVTDIKLTVEINVKQIYVKSQLDRYLLGLLGSVSLVDQWWHSSNKSFAGKTPMETYHSGEKGRVMVADYIISHCNGDYH